MNVEFGTEGAQFPEKEYINGIFLPVLINKNLALRVSADGSRTRGVVGV
jgi:hypothetical protein